MFNLSKRTDGNEKYHLLPVANADYVVARFAVFNCNFTTAHSLISQAIEKYIKLIITCYDQEYKWVHKHRQLLEEHRNIPFFRSILKNQDYMELIDEIDHDKFIATRYGENYLSAEFPKLIDTLDSLVRDFHEALPNGPKKITVHEDYKDIFLRGNKSWNEADLKKIQL